ncbi:MAG: thioredoxin domain-containing protein [Gemmatimonadota bacterium]
MTGFYLKNEVLYNAANMGYEQPERVAEELWMEAAATGYNMGPPDAAITIVEFMDFECVHCRSLVERINQLKSEFPGKIRVVLQHFPLSAASRESSQAFECAAAQSRGDEMYAALFSNQERLRKVSFEVVAREAVVPDLPSFRACVDADESFPRIADGSALGNRLGLVGTPTVLMDGFRLWSTQLDHLRERAVLTTDGIIE